MRFVFAVWRVRGCNWKVARARIVGSALILASPAAATAQFPVELGAAVRTGVALHAAGLQLGSSYRHRVEPALAVGATVSFAHKSRRFGLQFDGDLVPSADIRRDPSGPPLENPTSGRSYWLATSFWVAPPWPCGSGCLRLTAGVGRSSYDYAVTEVRGDVVSPLAPKQRPLSGRFGLEATLPFLRRRVVLQVVDHVGTLEPFYSGESLSTMHTVVISTGIRFGRH